ncbi:alpha/beta hydrolase [Streptomyces sp. NBC_01288]|uniref:alpha/beta fold hydrolase n=1 Tax=Streptomyces sp. NBC_01288 TaxID=2903814 RepID=UPI002E0D7CA0|nr:alpha/beta hydrolase [Streptomyces sp. NBC_01288]
MCILHFFFHDRLWIRRFSRYRVEANPRCLPCHGLPGPHYRVANVDIRGCGESSLGWDGYSRTDIAGDLVAVVRHLGGPAVIIGQSISGGAATIAAATAPDVISGVIELAPFTRAQPVDLGGLIRVKRFRTGSEDFKSSETVVTL